MNDDISVTAYFNLPSSPPLSFDPAMYIDTGHGSTSVAVGDLNRDGPLDLAVVGDFNLDGFQDLAVANQGSNTVSVVLGP